MSDVKLFVYDLSQGMARQISPALLGKQIDGIWHSAVCAFDTEYYFGGGICTDAPGNTPYGTPVHTHRLGRTTKTRAEFLSFLASIANRFTPAGYHLLDNNCNHFSDECTRFLLGAHIPDYVRDLPAQVMDSQLGLMLRPMVESMQAAIVQQSQGHELSLPNAPAHAPQPAGSAASTSANSSTVPRTAQPPKDDTPAARLAQLAKQPVLLTNGNVAAIARKLAEFDPSLTPDRTTSTDSDAVTRLLEHARTAPLTQAFPSLDLLRLAVASNATAAQAVLPALPALLKRHVADAPTLHPPSAIMALRLALNLHAHAAPSAPDVLDVLETALSVTPPRPTSPPLVKTAALLALNVAAAPRRHGSPLLRLNEADVARLLFIIHDALAAQPPPSPLVAAPLLRAAALLVEGDPDAAAVLDAYGLDENYRADDDDADVQNAARLLHDVRPVRTA